ncbi:MAG: hypothetical protein LBF76_02570, partial [Holosporales bacterium]|nr:hypothetical protein [Holosporales bacterium]
MRSLRDESFLSHGWKLSFGLHVGIALVCFIGFPAPRISPPMEVIPVGLTFADVVSEAPAPLGIPDGTEVEAVPEPLPAQELPEPSPQESTPESVAPPLAPRSPAIEAPPPKPQGDVSAPPEPLAVPASPPVVPSPPEPVPVPEPPPAPSPPEKLVAPQKAPPSVQPVQTQKLDKLVESTVGAQEDFLSVLKNVEKGARKQVQKNTEKKSSRGKSAKTRKGVAGGALEGHLSAGEEDLIRRQIYPHWSILGGMMEAENLIVELRLQISEDGTVTDIQILDKARFQRDPLYRV